MKGWANVEKCRREKYTWRKPLRDTTCMHGCLQWPQCRPI